MAAGRSMPLQERFQVLTALLGQIYGYPTKLSPSGWNISTERQQLISSLMTLGAFISSGTAGFVARWLGRRPCLWMACALCCVSNIVMMTTTEIGPLYAGRLLNGLANGWFMTFSQLYIQESSPAKYRGLFLTAFTFMTSFVSCARTARHLATFASGDISRY
jgi:MFS family permease